MAMLRSVYLYCLATILAIALSANMTRFLLQEEPKFGATCLDGSPPSYYFTPGSGSGARHWYIHHQGGGWCTSITNCYQRSQTRLGSSKFTTPVIELPGGYFSNDPKVNPMMYNWNKVYIMYCDGGSYAGDNETVCDVLSALLILGFRNLQATMMDLYRKHEFGPANSVVISGCSAGGLATYLHLDWWANALTTNARVWGLPDSGFFLDYNSTIAGGPKYSRDMRWVFHHMNATGGVNQECILANAGDPAKCFFAEHTAPHIKTPFFPLQSIYDSWQTAHILGSTDATEINKFGKDAAKRFATNVLQNPRNGAFLDSCHHHCGSWNQIIINNTTSSLAFQTFWQTGQGVYIDTETYPCSDCCSPNTQSHLKTLLGDFTAETEMPESYLFEIHRLESQPRPQLLRVV